MSGIEDFRAETREWLEEFCPPGARAGGGGGKDMQLWRERLIEKGLTAPTWPTEYGGGGLNNEQYMTLIQELRRVRAGVPFGGMGLSLIGPTLLELGTDDQKQRHLPPIVRGEVNWCQGYSEPSSGSDLASLRTRAVDNGDHFVINGQKIWTSGAQFADWMFALVRTDPDVPKHEGISFVLLTMHQPGVTVKPIRLDQRQFAILRDLLRQRDRRRKRTLVGELNKGWTIGKRLLQFERGSMATLVGGAAVRRGGSHPGGQKPRSTPVNAMAASRTTRCACASSYPQHQQPGVSPDPATNGARMPPTDERPGPATSIFKMYGTELQQDKSSLLVEMRGTRGFGWEGEQLFDQRELGRHADVPGEPRGFDLQRQQRDPTQHHRQARTRLPD